MDDLTARIVSRLLRDAKDWADTAAINRTAGTRWNAFDRGQAEGLRRAASLVKEMAAEEQARIAEEERADYSAP